MQFFFANDATSKNFHSILFIYSGPSAWSNEYSTCKGKHQSPIDIDMLHVKKVKLPSLKLHNFDKAPNASQIENNGHTGKQGMKIEGLDEEG